MHRRDLSTRLARAQSTTVVLLLLLLLLLSRTAFSFSVTTTLKSPCFLVTRTTTTRPRTTTSTQFLFASNVDISASRFSKGLRLWESSSSKNDDNKQDETNRSNPSDATTLVSGDMDDVVILRGSGNDDLDGSIWADIETGQPPQWMVMKELLGINIFTYFLAGLIALFLSLNFFLGPGWLGQAMGMQGTGSFTEVSDSLPDTVDLSRPEFRL